MRIKSLLLSGVCVGASALMAASAQAQSSSDLDKVEQMQRQMEQMQDQIKSLKGEVAKNKSIDMSALKGAYGADVPRSKSPLVKAVPFMEHVKLTMGGFFAGETVYRQHNATSDESTSFGSIPFPFSPAYKESEFRGSLPKAISIPSGNSPVTWRRTSSALEQLRITTRATVGRRVYGRAISPMTTTVPAFTS
jgi:hypothetical protein